MVAMFAFAVSIVLVLVAVRGTALALAVSREPVVSLPFEAGTVPQQHAMSRYHARWYSVTLIFLAFDMEMIFMYPWAVVVEDMGAVSLVEMFGFLGVLFVGVIYAWREGALRWV